MKIYNVTDKEFAEYGKVITGYDVNEIVETLDKKTPSPEGVEYVAEEPLLQGLSINKIIGNILFGGMPYQMGYCNGKNTKLNCLEYHRDSEFNLGSTDFILLLAKMSDIVDYKFDTSKVKAFYVKKGQLVEVYATTLHYAPCSAKKREGFKVLVALPKGTNVGKAEATGKFFEDKLLFATNKWLIAHQSASEVKDGAYVGLVGENTDIANDI